MENNKPTTKVNMDEDKGDGWSKIANVSQLNLKTYYFLKQTKITRLLETDAKKKKMRKSFCLLWEYYS